MDIINSSALLFATIVLKANPDLISSYPSRNDVSHLTTLKKEKHFFLDLNHGHDRPSSNFIQLRRLTRR